MSQLWRVSNQTTLKKGSLISDEKAFMRQAGSGKGLDSTLIERKQMSTKTSIKRIALVAVSAVGFGVLTSVAPASAANTLSADLYRLSTAALADATTATYSDIIREDAGALIRVNLADIANPGEATLRARFTASADATLKTVLPATIGTAGGDTDGSDGVGGSGWVDGDDTTATTLNSILGAFTPAATTVPGFYGLTDVTADVTTGLAASLPASAGSYVSLLIAGTDIDAAGSYTVQVWNDTNGDAAVSTGEATVSVSFTAAGAAASVSISSTKSLVFGGENITMCYSAFDANGYLTVNPGTDISATAGLLGVGAVDTAVLASGTKDSGRFCSAATAVAANPTDKAYTLSVGALTGTGTVTAITQAKNAAAAITPISKWEITNTTGFDPANVYNLPYINTASGTDTVTVDPTVTSISFKVTSTIATNGSYIAYQIEDSNTASVPNSTSPVLVRVDTTGQALFSVTNAAPATTDTFQVRLLTESAATGLVGTANTDDMVYTFAYSKAKPVISIISPDAGIKVVNGGTNSFKVRVKDLFGKVLAGQSVTVAVTGRNTLSATITTDASGYATYSYTDAGTTALATSDTVKFNAINAAGSATEKSYTVTYITAAVAVATIGITNTETARVVDTVQSDADFGYAAATALTTIKATLRKADGTVAGSGIVVTFTGGSADDLFVDDVNTGITDANGEATVEAYRNKVGTTTFTASANGVTSAASTPTKWTNTDGTSARYVTVTADPAKAPSEGVIRITAKVTDRWGNPVNSVDLAISEDGAGRLYTGVAATGATSATGTYSWDMTSLKDEMGTNTVTVTVTEAGTQVENLANKVGTATVTGVTAGVKSASASVEFTKNTSVSTADALLELAKAIGTGKEVEAAADAAAEAIDAANAATDAANLAAEAADAATVAAEEARDAADAATAAVEELSTQVATLMAALKAQLTTLANTVAKIAKKVKA